MTTCPHCDSDNTTWLNIVGDAANPIGALYTCENCGNEFDDLPDDIPAWQLGGGRQ